LAPPTYPHIRRIIHENVEMSGGGNVLTIKVDLSKDYGPSSGIF
jgi:hypothetical protein